MRIFLLTLALILSFAIGFYSGLGYNSQKFKSEVGSTLMLERIREVFKVAAMEAEYSELFTHKDYAWFDLSPFRKVALIRVKAKVLAGFDLDTSQVKIDEKLKTIFLHFHSNAKILSLDHQLDYYDLQQGTFNYFTPQELTLIQDKARDIILRKAEGSDLLKRADARRLELVQAIDELCKNLGWKVEMVISPEPKRPFIQ